MTKEAQESALYEATDTLEEVIAAIHPQLANKLAPQLRHIRTVGSNFIAEHVEAEDNPSIYGSRAWFDAAAECRDGCTCSRHIELQRLADWLNAVTAAG